jgi:predicted DNA-binding transcriptional regulator YafY
MKINKVVEFKFQEERVLQFDYLNWRGESSKRIARMNSLYKGSNEYHKDNQWIMVGIDLEKNQERHFAVKDMSNVKVMDDILDDIQYVEQYCQCGAEVPTPFQLVELDDEGEVIKCTNCVGGKENA